MKVENGKMERPITYLKNSYISFKKRRKRIRPLILIDKYGNRVSMFETIKKVDEETVTKEKNIPMTRDHTASLLSGNVEYLFQTWKY